MLSAQQIDDRISDFEVRFGPGGEIGRYFAPGRVNLIGEHTDYNGGLVLPIAIEQGTYLLIRQTEDPPVRLFSASNNEEASFYPDDISKSDDWADYVRGVFLFARENCSEIPPFEALFFGDLPIGAGLSSSASIELLTATGLEAVGCSLSLKEAVRISKEAENDFVGVQCGIMDQFAIAFAKRGHALMLDCDSHEFRQVPFNLERVNLIVGHTGVYRSLSDSPYNTRREECEQALGLLSRLLGEKRSLSEIAVTEFEGVRGDLPERLARRVEHVIFENERVKEAARCLEEGDFRGFGEKMQQSHESLRDLYEVSSRELDVLQEISMNQSGVWGCRMTGAGFGGCVVTLVDSDVVREYLDRVPGLYLEATDLEPAFWVTSPGDGARRLEEQ